jgi:hypothetical protein
MSRPSPRSVPVAFLLAAAISACGSPKPADAPETSEAPASSAAADMPKDTGKDPAAGDDPAAAPSPGAAPARKVDPSLSIDTYEMTPSDCDALGSHYGEVARSDQMAALSPKLSDKQRAATAAQVDKVVGTLSEKWIGGCQTSLVNRAVDHDAIKCALGSKTVKAFDVCLNGASGTPQPAGKKK